MFLSFEHIVETSHQARTSRHTGITTAFSYILAVLLLVHVAN